MSEKEVLQSLLEAANGKITDLTAEVTNLASKLADAQSRPELEVSEGPMPESNGKSNFTAILQRKGANLFDSAHFTIARSEYPDRVRYEADCVRHIIGELSEWPCILDYDADEHSGYVAPAIAAPVVQVAGGEPILRAALERIARWHGEFPDAGTWPDGTKKSYGGAFGSNGERDYMRQIALDALASARAADAPSEPSELQWRDQFWKLALALDCFPSQFIDANEHVFKAVELLKYRAADALGSQPTETAVPNGWISVMDQLPGIGREVNVYCPNKDNEYRRVTALCRLIRYEGATEFYWDNCYGGSNIHLQESVTHWQPAPPAPVAQPTDTTRKA